MLHKAMPSQFKHAFFVAGGTLAVENAVKAACDYKIRKNLANGKAEVEQAVLHFQEAFHGRSGYTLSLTNTSDPKKYMYFPRFGAWPRIAPPKCVFPLEGNNLAAVIAAESAALTQIEQYLAKPDANVYAYCPLPQPTHSRLEPVSSWSPFRARAVTIISAPSFGKACASWRTSTTCCS
jgi:4-aminobutyrate aminotransferase-like enzyme